MHKLMNPISCFPGVPQYRLWLVELVLCRRDDGLYLSLRRGFHETGENREIVNAYKVQLQKNERQFWNVRSFPEGFRNCYTLKPTLGEQGTRYMIPARFMYGKYDNENQAPTFDLYLGVDYWDTVITQYAWFKVNKEIIFFPKSVDHIYVCLVNTGHGIPFISALELRPWVDENETYVSKSGLLGLFQRSDLNPAIDQVMRLASLEFYVFIFFNLIVIIILAP